MLPTRFHEQLNLLLTRVFVTIQSDQLRSGSLHSVSRLIHCHQLSRPSEVKLGWLLSIGEEGTDCEIAGSLFSRSSLDFYEKDASGSECLLSMEDEKSTFLGSEFGNAERESTKTPCSAFDQIGRELGAPWSASVSFIANCLPISQAAWLQHFLIAPNDLESVWTLVVAWLPLGSLFSGGERSVAWWSLVSLERPGCSQGISAQTGFLSKHLCGRAFRLILNRFQAWLQVHLGMLPTPLVSAT